MDHATAIAAFLGAVLLAGLHALPDLALILQFTAVGTFVGTTIAYLRASDTDQRFRLTYRWTCTLSVIGIAVVAGSWIGIW